MLALLSKLVPFRDWVYLGAIVALLITFGVYTHHERAIGEHKIEAVDAKLAAAQRQHNQKVEDNAQSDIGASVAQYNVSVGGPLAPVPVLVCNRAPGPAAVRDHAGAPAASDGRASVPAESTVPFDPAPAVINDARDADAQVTLLQSYIRACQKAGFCKAN